MKEFLNDDSAGDSSIDDSGGNETLTGDWALL